METKGMQKNDGENPPKNNLKSWKKLWLFFYFSVLFCSPCILILPLMLLAHSLPTPFIGHNPNNLFCHSPFHSISEPQSCQNKLRPALVLKLTQSSSSFPRPPAENTLRSAGLSLNHIQQSQVWRRLFSVCSPRKPIPNFTNNLFLLTPISPSQIFPPHYKQREWKSRTKKSQHII